MLFPFWFSKSQHTLASEYAYEKPKLHTSLPHQPTDRNELFHQLTNHRFGVFLSVSSRAHRVKFWFHLGFSQYTVPISSNTVASRLIDTQKISFGEKSKGEAVPKRNGFPLLSSCESVADSTQAKQTVKRSFTCRISMRHGRCRFSASGKSTDLGRGRTRNRRCGRPATNQPRHPAVYF
ncbi:hypothetical protein TNCV_884521 [Trichonephila clavipes]|nr:hypothetical protein TNCV_884521 [Trichonephila clavipes]